MADTFTAAISAATTWTASRQMAVLVNTGSSAVRVTRIWAYNTGIATVTTATSIHQLWRGTVIGATVSGGTAFIPIRHNPSGTASLTGILCMTLPTAGNGELTKTGLLGQYIQAQDEMTVTTTQLEDLQALKPLTLIWDAGYKDANVEPIVLRTNQGICLQTLAAGTGVGQGGTYAGTSMFNIEFTVAAS
jgi:hypothetical protein